MLEGGPEQFVGDGADSILRDIGCPNRPMTGEELCREFMSNVIGAESAGRVLDACMNLQSLPDVTELIGWLAPKR